jgi:hypothetical protein
MKKILYAALFVSVLALASGVAFAATSTPNKTKTPVSYTVKQQACITSKEQPSMKTAQDAFNAATKDALKARQDALKPAQDAFNAATKDELKAKQDAIIAAQKITDKTAKVAAIRAANDAYISNPDVVKAKVLYEAALKDVNVSYNNNNEVKQAKGPYSTALRAARASAIKDCTSVSFLQIIQNIMQKSAAAIVNAFTFVK